MSGDSGFTVAFFGATGGCTLAALVKTLEAGYKCSALVRTPAKLTALLSEQSVSEQVQQAQLRVVRGNATEPAAVKDALQDSPGQLVSLIVSGVGGTPKFWPNPLRPTLDQPTICQDSMKAVVQAVKDIRASSPSYAPYAVAISTTGVDAGVDDVPLLMHPLYHWLLPVPHADKRLMEEALQAGAKEGVFSHFTIVRPSLLTTGESSYDAIRAGYSGRPAQENDRWNSRGGEAIGYTVSRNDVGKFIFEEIVSKHGESEWGDKKVTLTY